MENPKEEKPRFLGTFGIIRSAIKIPFRNPSFIILTVITSFPLFCMMIVPRLPYKLQPNLVMEASLQLTQSISHSNPLISTTAWIVDMGIRALKEILFHLLNFLIAVTAIYSASTIYTSTTVRSKGLRDLLQNPITTKRWRGPLYTFLFMSLISNISFHAIVWWYDAGPLSSVSNKFLQSLYFIIFIAAHVKWREYSGWWNLAVVVSVLEEKRGFGAFSTSSQLSKGNRLRTFVLMLLYDVWRIGLFHPLRRWNFSSRIASVLVDKSLFCLGIVMNWVVLTVYYYDCKNRRREEKAAAIEEEKGQKPHFLGTFGIIRSSLEIPLRNPSFIIFTFITSLPPFFMLIVPKLPYNLQPTLLMEVSYQLRRLEFHSHPLISAAGWVLNFCGIIQVLLTLLYDLVSFLSAAIAIYSFSKIYTSGRSKGLKDLLQNPIPKRWGGPLSTFLFTSLFTNSSLDVLNFLLETSPFRSVTNKYSQPLNFIVYVAAFAKFVEYTAWWNVAVVVSVLEGKTGFGAYSTSSQLCRGSRVRGFILMLLYSVWRIGMPILISRWRFSSRLTSDFLDRGSIYLANVLNWVAFTVYYHDCKNRRREEKAAIEEDKGYAAVNANVP